MHTWISWLDANIKRMVYLLNKQAQSYSGAYQLLTRVQSRAWLGQFVCTSDGAKPSNNTEILYDTGEATRHGIVRVYLCDAKSF